MSKSLAGHWKPVWSKYDPGEIFRNAIVSGITTIPEASKEYIASLAFVILMPDEFLILPPDHQDLLMFAQKQGLFSCFHSSLPYPCLTDNMCSIRGLKTQSMKDEKPENLSLAIGSLKATNSDLVATGNKVVGATFNYPLRKTLLVAPDKDGVLFNETNGKGVKDISIGFLFIFVLGISIFILLIIIGAKLVVTSNNSGRVGNGYSSPIGI